MHVSSAPRRYCVLLITLLAAGTVSAADNVVSLAGSWQFIRGGPALSQTPSTLPALSFADTIQLPGTTETNRKGPPNDNRSADGLSFPWAFVGPCWYARDVTIPDHWRGRRVTLLLERTKYTQVWLDHQPIGDNGICCTPQEYELGSSITPGTHRLIVAVDNKRIPPMGADAHQFSGATQGNWNGIIGKIELRATPNVWIDQVQAYPSAADHYVRVKVQIKSSADVDGDGVVSFEVHGPGVSATHLPDESLHWTHGSGELEEPIDLYPAAELWDEFHPNLQKLTVRFHSAAGDDEKRVTFGLRDFVAHGQQFTVNDQPIFLRGKHDACVFPLTGHPPMDVDGWLTYFRTLQSYGLNHVRFHTWTPPEAAFEAADQLGFYLQPELPFWGPFDQKVKDRLKPEAVRILEQLGNHPSFVMFSMGNEHWAGAEVLDSLVAELKALDKRHLYVRGTNAFSYRGRPGPKDDYFIGADLAPRDGAPIQHIRAANMGVGDVLGHVQRGPANTLHDYSTAVAGTTFPSVTHEMGQYTVYPNYQQIDQYTGVTRAYNLETLRHGLAKAGMADQDADFAAASGTLAAIGYREEIESCLRTPHFGGFELLDLVDYPGQGSALVGMLDVFMHSKNILTPEQWRQFCSPTVLLARFPKYVWTVDEPFTAEVDVANYGAGAIAETKLNWNLIAADGKSLRSGTVAAAPSNAGGVTRLATLNIPLTDLAAPAQATLLLDLQGTKINTSYPLWIYPASLNTPPPTDVTLARTLDSTACDALAKGQRVLLICDEHNPLANTVGGGFASDFWGFNFFHNKPGTVGLLCDPHAPALAAFPTESHSNWQWFSIAMHSQPLILDAALPPGAKPIVQVIDNDVRNHKLGLVFETKVGPGSLLICASDLIGLSPDHAEARQLLDSLIDYVHGSSFNPSTAIAPENLDALLQPLVPMEGATASASSFDNGWQGYKPGNLIDSNDAKGWMADKNQTGPVCCQIDFKEPVDFDALEVLWNRPGPGFEFEIQSSADGTVWDKLQDHCGKDMPAARQRVAITAHAVKHLRLVIQNTPDHSTPAIQEIRLFPKNSNSTR